MLGIDVLAKIEFKNKIIYEMSRPVSQVYYRELNMDCLEKPATKIITNKNLKKYKIKSKEEDC